MTDGRHTRRLDNVRRALAAAVRLLEKGESFDVNDIANDAELSVRSVYRHWDTLDNLKLHAGAVLSTQMTEGTPLPNAHQQVLRRPAVAIAILVAAREGGAINPRAVFQRLDNAARLCDGDITEGDPEHDNE